MKQYALILLVFTFLYPPPLLADDIDLFTTQANPNVLIILDNSNSMDEDFFGNAVGSFSPSSKTVVGKKALRDITDQLKDKLRMGLMTYKLPAVEVRFLHNSQYFVSYDPRSYCPSPPPECVTYARTGNGDAKSICRSTCQAANPSFDVDYFRTATLGDEIISASPIGSQRRDNYANLAYPHTQRIVNPSSPSNYIYFKHAYPMYSESNLGTAFCFAPGYDTNAIPAGGNSSYYYNCYRTKTGTSDDESGYSNSFANYQFGPTDSDVALGYDNFGRRQSWYYVGQTWFSNTSPGKGYLQVQVGDSVDQVWKKLDPKENEEAGYMSCSTGDKNTCPYILNAGLTPTAGTMEEATRYFKGQGGYPSPIDYWCRKNFIIYVTDGLPSVDESGTPGTANSLMPTVLRKIDALRDIVINLGGKNYHFDVKTYVLGVGLSDEAKLELDKMAVRGGTDVSGHAYYADNPKQLTDALNQIFANVVESAYSFTSPTVPSVRMTDKDILYLSSFTPSDKNPFWPGSLKGYQLNADGSLSVNDGFPVNAPVWVASIPTSGSRSIKTYVGGALKDFTSSNLAPGDLGVETTAERDSSISYVRSLPLGDIFHSNSVMVGSPSQFFEDAGFSGTGGFYERNKDRKKLIIVGANDGMLHAFDAATGVEKWAFIPNSLLKNLKLMRTTKDHIYFVDSTPRVADVWLDYNGDNKKSADEWETVLICALRKGGNTYFALKITKTDNFPEYLWELPKSTDAATLSLVGQSWSEPAIGRVKIEKAGSLVERWVAFIGGGYDKEDNKGRAFFVVDVKTGEIIWQFLYDNKDSVKKDLKYSFPASPTAIDTNFDGYVDKVYIGDLGGQMWVFDVSFNEFTKKSDSLWAGKVIFAPKDSSKKHKIYYAPAVAFDQNGIPWVYFGTGDRENPNDKNSQETFYAVKDDGLGNYPRKEGDLADLIGLNKNNFIPVSGKGWYITFSQQSEKVLAKPAVFNRLVYFTTYTPETKGDKDFCAPAGVSKEYVVEFLSGGGAFNIDDLSDILSPPADFVYKRSQEIGGGAPSAPVITVDMKGKASVSIGTTSGQILSRGAPSRSTNKEILFWREVVP